MFGPTTADIFWNLNTGDLNLYGLWPLYSHHSDVTIFNFSYLRLQNTKRNIDKNSDAKEEIALTKGEGI